MKRFTYLLTKSLAEMRPDVNKPEYTQWLNDCLAVSVVCMTQFEKFSQAEFLENCKKEMK